MKIKALLLLVLALGATVSAQSKVPSASSKRDDIIRLLRMTGATEGGAQSLDLILPPLKEAMPQVPEKLWSELRNEVRDQDMIELTYVIWDKHFTHQEIRELIRFYQSPTGQKIIRETPAIQQESLVAGQKWGHQVLTRVLARLREKGYELPPDYDK